MKPKPPPAAATAKENNAVVVVDESPRPFRRGRREILASALGTISAAVVLSPKGGDPSPAPPAFAFDNKISNKYDDRPKRRGPKPADLGVQKRKNIDGEEYLGLKQCSGNGAPNCFVSDLHDDFDPDHSIPPWVWPEELGTGSDGRSRAFRQLAEVVESYQPGQSNVDGGGFKIVASDPDNGYIYVQFEALKNGYVDDVEIAYIDENKNNNGAAAAAKEGGGGGERSVQVRSSSRIGYLDFGVNAKRLNFLAKNLRAKGWDAEGVDLGKHQNYAIQNEMI